ncbi:hypothetical protein HK405_008203 [Cladochytrium tenue]|nr:hypothetical protein HK405_008203 [Cladochytrium tenue]
MAIAPVYNPDGSYNYAYSLFGEAPRKQLAFTAVAVFLLAAFLHTVQAVRFKAAFVAPAIIGAVIEVAGYAMRSKAIDEPFNSGFYVAQAVLLILGPVFVAATQYIVIEKIMDFVDPALSPVRPSLIAKIFVASDVVSLFVQGAGAGLLSGSTSGANIGRVILITGLAFQVVCFCAYLAVCFIYYRRATASAAGDPTSRAARAGRTWLPLFYVLVVSSTLVLIRSVFRTIEFSLGYKGPVATNEIYLYTFDALLMALALFLFNIVHPQAALHSARKKTIDEVEFSEIMLNEHAAHGHVSVV